MSNPLRVGLSGAAVLAVAAGIWIAVGHVGSGVAATQRSSATANRTVLTDKNLNPFGAPAGNGDFKVPGPPEEPTLVPTSGFVDIAHLFADEAAAFTRRPDARTLPEGGTSARSGGAFRRRRACQL